ncbi:FUSC family protein [Francisella sp. LA112445]|uniref:FUSC family protein n=1 Tax=Francisella sp. LA112445 TaxID=1395624 RepID=UPI00247B0517|nr:FUSC family protein [Francisella sp. LA112445]
MIEEIFTKNNFIYTFKSFLALTLALIVSIGLDVDKPMWAMITVLFIQTRPETGFIIEKGVLRIISSCVGIIVGFIIINLFLPFPTLAIFFLCVFISITMFFSVSMSHPNFIYALAIANTTCTIIIFDSMAKPLLTNSESIFHIGYSRFTEIMIGCLCSFLVNYYIFPVKIKDRLKSNADESLNLTVNYIKNVFSIKNFSNNEKHNKEVESILNSLIVLDNELSASKYESYNSKIYNDFTIKIIELIQSAHFLRKYTIKNKLNTSFREKLNKIGHKLSRFDSAKDKSILISDNKLINEVIIRFNSVVENYNLIVNNEMPKARNGEYFKFKNYNNVALAFFTISKATFLIMLLAFIWMNTQGNSSLFSMLFLPCLLSQLMIPAPNGAKLIKENIIGIIIAIPIGIFFTLNLLAQVEGYFELLILVLLIALFFSYYYNA